MNEVIIANSLFFNPKKGSEPILDNISFRLHKNELLCLAGVNGSGKSSLLNILAGLYSLDSGDLKIFGLDLLTAKKEEKTLLRYKTAMLVQDADMQILGATVEEDLLLSFASQKKEKLKKTKSSKSFKEKRQEIQEKNLLAKTQNLAEARNLAERFGLLDKWQSSVLSLSYGQKRKLCLAGALLRKPELLLLDEPFSGLDYPGIKELLSILKSFKKSGIAIIVSTHDLSLLQDIADSYLFISAKTKSLFGSAQELFPKAEEFKIRI